MRPEFASMSRRASNVVSEMDSHLTILKPRESTPSDILSAVAMFLNVTEKETWIRRAKLFFRILSFSLGPGNIWRFPQQSFIYGNATYLYFYILYSWTVGVSVLVFEIHLSQYFLKGFARLFTLCPIMEGITLAMVFYCIMATILYSMIGVYSFVYILSGFYFEMPHSYCSEDIINYDCESRYTNRTHSPEYVYFYKYVERLMENYGDIYNWRNAVILIIMWSIVACIIWQGLLRFHWIGTVLSILITVVLLFVAILSLTLPGAFDGVSRMFVPRKNDINHIQTWIYPLEQSIVSLGVGAGPLTTIWTMSKIKYWSPVDCVLINIITFLCSMLAGIIFFNAAGAVTIYTNSTIDKFIGDCQKDVHIHVIYTPMFNMLDMGLSNFTVAIYYFVLFCSCLYSLNIFKFCFYI